jgi:quercetin dioxygenase-like cupin family protein
VGRRESVGFATVEAKDLRDLVVFSDEGPVHRELFESERLWSELVCLERTQQLGPISDPGSDAVLTVVAGEVVVHVGRGRKRLRQWGATMAPAGSAVTLTNASVDPAVVLIVAAPPPRRADRPE